MSEIGKDVSLGYRTYVNKNTYIMSGTIGKYCSIGYNCNIGMPEHPTNYVSTQIYKNASYSYELYFDEYYAPPHYRE
jgi:acetyltransferase-like isoleucine patch superfamily enzyme